VNSANGLTLYAITCAGAPTAELCTDPLQMQTFLMGVTMAQGITMGAPLFGSPKDFVQTMEGQGMLGPLLTVMGMKPVKFQSESDFTKSISVESKVFSIYAIGVVKGYKRQTRVKIHTVIDFRTAPSLLATGSGSGTKTAPTAPAGGGGGQQIGGLNAMQAALDPSVGGQVLYFNIE
jgi:general secretion pathway protein K